MKHIVIRTFIVAFIGLLSSFILSKAIAATTTSTLNVSAIVAAACTVTTSPVTFGSQSNFATNIDANGSLTVTCTNAAPYTIALDKGAGSGATVALRKMTSGVNTLSYSLYQGSVGSQIWGDTTLGTTIYSGTGTGLAQNIIVYGRIPSGQNPAVGSYTDTVNVTISF